MWEKNKGMNEKIRKENATSRAASERCDHVDHIHDRNTFQFICCKTQLAHTLICIQDKNTQAEEE